MPSDELDVIEKAVNGDSKAFSILIDSYYDTIYRIAYKWCGNKEDAEDISQESCVKVARNISAFKMESKFTSWLYRIVINTANDYYRKNNKHKTNDDIVNIESSDPSAIDVIQCKELWKKVNKLPDNYRDAIFLIYSEGLNHKETAEIMQCAESTVSWYVLEAKKKLKKMIV
jgi:RNA polymerase sigma-70 factor (ECF subfamily)